MVATVSALGGGAGDYYLSGYYNGSGESAGEWFGTAAKQLGLTGRVQDQAFRNLLAGRSPDGRRQLIKIPKQTSTQKNRPHCSGMDITESFSKSITAFWASADATTKRRIEQICKTATIDTMSWFEKNVPLARAGMGGQEKVFANLVYAIFRHSTSRNIQDPQLHFHIVLPNICQQLGTGKYSKINSRFIFEWTRTLGPMIRNNVVEAMSREFGLEFEEAKLGNGKQAGWSEIVGVPKALMAKWSTRSDEIKNALGLFGGDNASAKAKQHANLTTRKHKIHAPIAELELGWQQQAKEMGFQPERLINVSRRQLSANAITKEFQRAFDAALESITESRAHFEYRDLIRNVSERLQTVPITANQITDRIDKQIELGQKVMSLGDAYGYRKFFTTPQMWNLERKMLKNVEQLRSRKGAVVKPSLVNREIKKRPTLRAEQVAAARELLIKPGQIKFLTGLAGSGKSYLLDTVRAAFEAAGYRVIGTALSGVAKEELASQAGIKSRTIASHIYRLDKSLAKLIAERIKHDIKMIVRAALKLPTYLPNGPLLDKKTVLVVDEAGMVGNKSMAKLVHHAKKAGATIILCGDPQQLSPIEAGGPFKKFVKDYGSASLSENHRQKNVHDKQAVSDIRSGKIKEALENYLKRGHLVITSTRQVAADQLVKAWAKDGGLNSPIGKIILTQTREEARQFNRRCQQERLISNAITGRKVDVGHDSIHKHDRVIFHKALRIKGIENGHRGTVTQIDPLRKNVRILLDHEPTAAGKAMGHSKTVTLTFEQLNQANTGLGYAATTHKLQGQTVEKAFVLLGGKLTDKQMAYVQASRASESTKFFIDKHHAGPDLELIQRDMQRSRIKDMAIEHAKQQNSQSR